MTKKGLCKNAIKVLIWKMSWENNMIRRRFRSAMDMNSGLVSGRHSDGIRPDKYLSKWSHVTWKLCLKRPKIGGQNFDFMTKITSDDERRWRQKNFGGKLVQLIPLTLINMGFYKFRKWVFSIVTISPTTHTREVNYSAFERYDTGLWFSFSEPAKKCLLLLCTAKHRNERLMKR